MIQRRLVLSITWPGARPDKPRALVDGHTPKKSKTAYPGGLAVFVLCGNQMFVVDSEPSCFS
jgi:hypothetical protein